MRFLGLFLILAFSASFAVSFYSYPFVHEGVKASELSIRANILYWNGEEVGWGITGFRNDSEGIVTGLRYKTAFGYMDADFSDGWINYTPTYITFPPYMNFDDMKLAEAVQSSINGNAGLGICSAVPIGRDIGALGTFWSLKRNAPAKEYDLLIENALKMLNRQYKNASYAKIGEGSWEIYKVGSR